MARILVFTDRHPEDPDWKGAIAWNLIQSLAESQHQVLVFTTRDPEAIDVRHPRLTIARPANSWRADHLPKFLQGILLFRPEVIHTFALHPSRSWKGLTIWPYLHTALKALPSLKRFSTIFECTDLPENDPSLGWHQGSRQNVVFSVAQEQELKDHLAFSLAVSPLEIEVSAIDTLDSAESPPFVLVPAPVSEWNNPSKDLLLLAKHLMENNDLHARVAGGWGEWPASSRRAAWSKMMPVADRLHMLEPLPLAKFLEQAKQCETLWCEPLNRDSWRDVLTAQVASQLHKPTHGSRPALNTGSTANFLSRLFAGTLEPWPHP